MKTISVIAPIALTERESPIAWRREINVHARLRSGWMLKSFFGRFDADGVDSFAIVCPERDRAILEELVRVETADSRVSVMGEESFFSQCGLKNVGRPGLSAWQLQQIIKLGYSRICPSEFYLALDSDIFQFRDGSVADIFLNDVKARAGVETAADYDRIYCGEFAAREKEAKARYYERSQGILGYERPRALAGRYFSETPVVFHKPSVIAMLEHMEHRHGGELVTALADRQGWTEISLYFQFLEMTGALEDIYALGDCNAVLALEKSIWQPSSCYGEQRYYDRQHFMTRPHGGEGLFLAIQSWIPEKQWLPARFHGVEDFYEQLNGWIDPASRPAGRAAASAESGHGGRLDSIHPTALLKILEHADPDSKLYPRALEILDATLENGPPIPEATGVREPKFLTIGMTTHNDYDGCYFTVQAIRLYHPEILDDVEFLVVDNDPAGPCAKSLKALESWAPNYRYLPYRSRQGTAVRDLIFREATGEVVLCVDCHVLFAPGSLARLIEYCRRNPESKDLLQGPLVSDALEPMATHFEPKWSHGMFGCWGLDERGKDSGSEPFEIEMQGLGVFACRRKEWPGFNPRLAGFGGEEGYVHEKIRRAGGRNLCLPFLRWMHRFERPMGIPYRPEWADRVRNYLLIFDELGLDPAPVIGHFEEFLGKEPARDMVRAAQNELASPFQFFDAIYCINLDRDQMRWAEMRRRFEKLGIARAVRRLAAADTPLSHHIGCALSHRRIVAEAKQQRLNAVLVFEDDARFSPDAAEVLTLSLRELQGRDWQLLYLGGYKAQDKLQSVAGCQNLVIPGWITCTQAIAYHHSVYDAILDAVPDKAVEMAFWVKEHLAIDQFYNRELKATRYLTWPVITTQSSILPDETRPFED